MLCNASGLPVRDAWVVGRTSTTSVHRYMTPFTGARYSSATDSPATRSVVDTSGRDDLERAVEIGRAASLLMVGNALNNLSVVIDSTDTRRVQELEREALQEAERFGDAHQARFMRGNLIAALVRDVVCADAALRLHRGPLTRRVRVRGPDHEGRRRRSASRCAHHAIPRVAHAQRSRTGALYGHARHLAVRTEMDGAADQRQLAFEAFYSFLLPQFEGSTR